MTENQVDRRWHFSIDVGGTFTDCVAASPLGNPCRLKLLSSGNIRSAASCIEQSNSQFTLQLPFTTVNDQFAGFACRLFAADGQCLGESKVASWRASSQIVELADLIADPTSATAIQLVSPFPAPVLAIRILMGLAPTQPIDGIDLRLGTTRGTNALLTRRGAKTALLTTMGFGDVLRIGTQQRPDLFALNVVKPEPLYDESVEILERLDQTGQILTKLDEAAAVASLEKLKQQGIESLAVSFLHSYINPVHELRIAQLAEPFGFANVTLSHQASPLVKYVPRTSTAVLDAYLNPILNSYVQSIRNAIGNSSSMKLMTSSGGLVDPAEFSGKDCILSGPAGGVVGFAQAARQVGLNRAIGFDMGGTSTDVSRLDGEVSLQNETRKAGVDIQTPTLAIETVAAGGGSICGYVSGRLTVGPQSAGADPGPACYGLGGPLTVTDLNVWLGRVPKDRFPFPLQLSAVEKQLQALASEIFDDSGTQYTLDNLALAFIEIANSHMAAAVNTVTTRQGSDPREYALVGFGGAAGQHLCGVADSLGISKVLLHPDAGILSAYGISQAVPIRVSEKSILQVLSPESMERLADVAEQLYETSREQLGCPSVKVNVRLLLCVQGTEQLLTKNLDWEERKSWDAVSIADEFWADFQNRYGYRQNRALEMQVLQVEVSEATSAETASIAIPEIDAASDKSEHHRLVRQMERRELVQGSTLTGPLVICEDYATTFVDTGWSVTLLENQQLILNRIETAKQDQDSHSTECQPHRLELFHHRLTEIATQMGLMLQMTCTSVNVKERLDFSCAIFDSNGDLIVNAPHIPVHLGAMSETVRATMRLNPTIAPGDHFVTNDPFQGGSHLPDVTVVSPVFGESGSQTPEFWVASRAHHAEIGGKTPGSMPPFSKSLSDEGIVLRNIRLREPDGKSSGDTTDPWQDIRHALESGDYPSRKIEDNLLDLQAQLAANLKGQQLLLDLNRSWSPEVVQAYCQHIQDAACDQTKKAIADLPAGKRSFSDRLDCGLTIRLTIEVVNGQLVLDFAGTDPVAGNNFNTNPAIVSSAVLYCLRLLLNSDLPLNDGVLRPIDIRLPVCFLNPLGENVESVPSNQLPAVVGGNVETSQRIVDVVLGALDIAAASQGTMNNFLFGDHSFGFYETIGGGTGATASCAGTDAVHSHMTNTRLTDPEILERRYPVRLLEFSIRKSSGGNGLHMGGNGMIRRFQFLKPLVVSLLTNRRGMDDSNAPFGLHGGQNGKSGENWLVDLNGSRSRLPASCQLDMQPGQQIEIRTPGGGGWGATAGDC